MTHGTEKAITKNSEINVHKIIQILGGNLNNFLY